MSMNVTSLFTKQQNFRLVQTESICWRENKSNQKIEICFEVGRKNIAGRENAGYQHFFLFPQCFQKAFFLLKSGLCGKELIPWPAF